MKDHLQDPFSGKHSRMFVVLFVLSLKSQEKWLRKCQIVNISQMQNTVLGASFLLFLFPILSNASTLIRHHVIFPTTAFSSSHFYHFEQCFSSRKYTNKSSLFHLFTSKTKSIKISVGTILLNFNMHLKTLLKWRFRLYVWGGAWDCPFLTSSQVIEMLLVLGTHF